jgi:hypothetical protein
VRNTEEIFEFIDDVKEIPDNINFFFPIYSDADTEIKTIEFPKKYKIFIERADRKIIIHIKNSARPQSSNKRRKLIRL